MPSPSSVTRMRSVPSSRSRRRSTCLPGGVNLIAFVSRLWITCWIRLGSASTTASRSSIVQVSLTSLSWAIGRAVVIAASTISDRRVGWRSTWNLPRIMRETSSMSSMRRACRRALDSIVRSASSSSCWSNSPLRRNCTQPRIDVIGVRSS